MRMFKATCVAVVAIGVSLVSGMALAAPDRERGSNENAGAEVQKRGDQDGRDRTRRNTKPIVNQAPAQTKYVVGGRNLRRELNGKGGASSVRVPGTNGIETYAGMTIS